VIDAKELQPLKAVLPIVVNKLFSPNTTSVIPMQYAKTFSPIDFTLDGIVIEANVVQ